MWIEGSVTVGQGAAGPFMLLERLFVPAHWLDSLQLALATEIMKRSGHAVPLANVSSPKGRPSAGSRYLFGSNFMRSGFLQHRSPGKRRGRSSLRGWSPSLEIMEPRVLLAGDILASIQGTVFHDVSRNGSATGAPTINGATVRLFRDSGNLQFDNGASTGDDVLVGTLMTGANGRYQFEDLSPGIYFVQANPVAGLLLPTNSAVRRIEIPASALSGRQGPFVDSFDIGRQIVSDPPFAQVTQRSSFDGALSHILGGERDVAVDTTTGILSVAINNAQPGLLEFESTPAGGGTLKLVWDGDNSGQFSPTGLANRDLTDGGQWTALEVGAVALQGSATGKLRVFSNAGRASEFSWTLPTASGNGTPLVVDFEQFQAVIGLGADFSAVGAVELEIVTSPGSSGEVDFVRLVGPTPFAADFGLLTAADLRVTVENAPAVIAGQSLIYTFLVANQGPSNTSNVQLEANLPVELSLIAVTPSQGSAQVTGQLVRAHLGNLASGQSATVQVHVSVSVTAAGTITTTATVSGPDFDPQLNNNTANPVVLVQRTIPSGNLPPRLDLNGLLAGLDLDLLVPAGVGSAPAVDPDTLEITDPDSDLMQSAVVLLVKDASTKPFPPDMLRVDVSGTSITAAFDPVSGALTLSGPGTLAEYQRVLRSLRFDHPLRGYEVMTQVLLLTISDGQVSSPTAQSRLTLDRFVIVAIILHADAASIPIPVPSAVVNGQPALGGVDAGGMGGDRFAAYGLGGSAAPSAKPSPLGVDAAIAGLDDFGTGGDRLDRILEYLADGDAAQMIALDSGDEIVPRQAVLKPAIASIPVASPAVVATIPVLPVERAPESELERPSSWLQWLPFIPLVAIPAFVYRHYWWLLWRKRKDSGPRQSQPS